MQRTMLAKRFITLFAAVALFAPAALAADLSDVGYLDQAQIGSLPVFQRANAQLAQFKSQLDAQFAAAMKSARSDAEKQSVSIEFQQKLADKQREIVGPMFTRAQLAISAVAATKHLSVVLDKQIVIYGGQDITSDVQNLITSSKAIATPSATPPPSEIGFVDQTALDALPKVKQANDDFAKFTDDTRKAFVAKFNQAKTDADKQQVAKDYRNAITAKQTDMLKPLVDSTKSATADAAGKHNLLLVVDRSEVLYGGTDLTNDVTTALGK